MRFLCALAMGLVMRFLVACGGDNQQGGVATRAQSAPANSLSASEAKENIGSRTTVCGEVKSPTYASGTRGQPTFLNLDQPFPNQIFTIIIWGNNRGNFPESPESLYRDERVCITGLIESFRGVPQIEATNSGQIQIIR